MTTEHEATRTLVKSPPELWAECSDAASLARHLGEFGEIKITRLEPETAVAWEGERVRGTVRIEPSAWGTRVTLTAQTIVDGVEEPVAVGSADVAVAFEQDAVSNEMVVVEETLVPAEPYVVEEPVAVAQAPVAETAVAPAPKARLMARIRAYFERAGVAKVRTVADPPGFERPPEPQALAVVPVAAESESAEAEPTPESVPAAAEREREHALPEPQPPPPELDPEAVLTAALDSLGQAHHRPFSRA
jgi:hypothetical protein